MSGPAPGRARPLLRELSGGVGDWGLLVPIAIALVTINGLNATAVFGGAGIAYVATALYFKVPVPVQPLKAFAAAAIALNLDAATIAAGALLMAGAMGLLAASGLARALAARFPLVLIRGIQAAVALLLVKAALDLASRGNWDGLPAIAPEVSVAMALTTCGVLFASAGPWRLPGALLALGVGAGVGLAVGGLPGPLELGPQPIAVSMPPGADFATALTALVLAQIPLTFGNSVVATADAEREYFGERAARVTPGRLAGSIALGNAAAGLIGSLPICHGAGGVTAHSRMGATRPAATIMAGGLLIALALAFGSSLPVLLMVFAPGALAGMLLFVAIQHGMLAARVSGAFAHGVVVTVGAVTLLAGNLAIGFAAGVVLLVARHLWARAAGAGDHRFGEEATT